MSSHLVQPDNLASRTPDLPTSSLSVAPQTGKKTPFELIFATIQSSEPDGDDDDSLIACDPIGSWRYYVQSVPFAVCHDLSQPAGSP